MIYIEIDIAWDTGAMKGEAMTETETPRNAKAQAKADKAYAKANRPWYKKKRFWVLGLIVLIALVTMLNQGDDGTTAAESPAASSQQTEGSGDAPAAEEPAEEPALEVTAQQLIDDLEANALAASNTYKGKRAIVTGKVENIDASGDYFTITGTDDFTFTSVRVDIDESLVETVSGFTTGQDVTVTGEITDVGEIMGYEIEAETIG